MTLEASPWLSMTAMLVGKKKSDGEGRIVTGHNENDPRDVSRIFPMVLLR